MTRAMRDGSTMILPGTDRQMTLGSQRVEPRCWAVGRKKAASIGLTAPSPCGTRRAAQLAAHAQRKFHDVQVGGMGWGARELVEGERGWAGSRSAGYRPLTVNSVFDLPQ